MRTTAAACCLALAAAGMAGCAPNRATVELQGICFPTADCTFSGACDKYWGGYVGTNAAGTVVVFLQVANNLPDNRNLLAGRLNTNDAHITEVVVSYTGAQTNTQTLGGNTFVPAGGTTVMPLQLLITGAGDILATVKVRGYYDDGRSFETGDFPIAVRSGAGACATNACATATKICPAGGANQCPVSCT